MKFTEAITKVIEAKNQKFVETIDVAVKLNINSKKQEQAVRANCLLPHPIPKEIKILVIDDSLTTEEINSFGITHYGGIEMVEKIEGGWLDFNLVITTSKMMPKILKLGKLLGPKGLMPNAKLGTVTNDLKKTVLEFKKGKTEFKNDTFGNVHVSIGKANFTTEQLEENFTFFLSLLKTKKHSSVKGQFIKKLHISSTMGKSFEVDI